MFGKGVSPRINITEYEDDFLTDAQDDAFLDYENYGKTPPRTRILRKNKERKSKDVATVSTKTKPINRRNTITAIFDDLISKADSLDNEQGKRSDKRSIKLLRGSERDLKLDISTAQTHAVQEQRQRDSLPVPLPRLKIETSKQFRCLSSRRVTLPPKANSANEVSNNGSKEENEDLSCSENRVAFYKTFSMLIRLGCSEKSGSERHPRRHISREEHLWQNELKDMIWLELQAWHADRTTLEQDSYLCTARDSVANFLQEIINYKFEQKSNGYTDMDSCNGCFSMYCQHCIDAQNKALREIEELMQSLEAAESLYPSSKAFAEHYPLYNSPVFVGKVKAMCLWYNMVKRQRLKLFILGRLLTLLQSKYYQWPVSMSYDGSLDASSPSDSNSSNSSIADMSSDKMAIDLSNVNPIALMVNGDKQCKITPYRKYIEDMLKTKGLTKSMNFLEKLHTSVLSKVQKTLEKPREDYDYNAVTTDSEEELRRYGFWSPEAQSLNLPSYRAIFLFISAIPLEVIHEFLRMRVEQKPKNPSPLSIRQLMRELKEGIKIALSQRKRTISYLRTAVHDRCVMYEKNINSFDASLYSVFEIYLEYFQKWVLLNQNTFQKNLLEDEWRFCCSVVDDIKGGKVLVEKTFSAILCTLLNVIGERLLERIHDISQDARRKENDELNKKQYLFAVCRELQSLFNEEREMGIKVVSFAKNVITSDMEKEYLEDWKKAVFSLKCCIPDAIGKIQSMCDLSSRENFDESDKLTLSSRCREILLQGYAFGFEFYKEMSQFVPTKNRDKLARSMVHFANLWMTFVMERFEKGRGKRPRWAYQGLDFLLTVCEPKHTRYLSDAEFEELKNKMDACISHVIGTTAPSTPDSGFHSASPRLSIELSRSYPRSRGSSPSPKPTYKSQRSASRKTSMERSPLNDAPDSPIFARREESLHESLIKLKLQPALRSERIRDSIETLENSMDEHLKDQELIGRVVTLTKDPVGKMFLRKRYVTFTWQRGIKIGQGRFGKVYTAVNNNTGEMMAMKEVAIQHNDTHSIRRIAEELKILEGIHHRNLVQYYGLEVHREEMLIFMEFCPEGTLESLVAATENGLPELLIRKYTYQLLCGVSVLHEHGIVHRDIKGANIFLTDDGDCLKIGDFGCAVRIKSHTTMPGELQGFVGTQAYMAPEIFTKIGPEGHGRAADIWSVGCVVVEMASGMRPWADYDSNYQIMFKVGIGERPEAPETLIDEGHDFLDRCLVHNPKDRATAAELLNHNFVKIGDDLD